MKLYTIEVCVVGTVWERDVNCPLSWRGSGVYDVDHEVYREFRQKVSADSLERALKLVSEWWKKNDPDWCSLGAVYYDPSTVEEKEDPDDGTIEEVYETDYDYDDPVFSDDAPERYSVEVEL